MRRRNAAFRTVPRRVVMAVAAITVLVLAACAVAPDGDAAHPVEGEGSPGIGDSDGIVLEADSWLLDGAADESADGDGDLAAGPEPRRASETISFVIDDSALGPGVTWRVTRVKANCLAGATDFPAPGSTALAQRLVGMVEGSCWYAEGWAEWKAVATLPDGRTASTTFAVVWGDGRSGTTFTCDGFRAVRCPDAVSADGPEHWLYPKLDPLPTSAGIVYCAEEGDTCINTSGSTAQIQFRGDEWKMRTVAAGDSIACTPRAFGINSPTGYRGLCFRVTG